MTKAERKELRAMQNMTCFRDEALLKMPHALDALDAKDALIADLLSFIVSGPKPQKVEELAWRTAELAALKARAGE